MNSDRIGLRHPGHRWMRNLRRAPSLTRQERALVDTALDQLAAGRYARRLAVQKALYATRKPGAAAPSRTAAPPAQAKAQA